jgi:DNA polymerase-4
MAPGTATILHADLDAFYASAEQLFDPTLRGRPIAVGGGVVLAASYEAKRLGVQSGMPGWRARQLCPDLCFVQGHFHEYQRLGDQVMAVLRDFTPLVERISIDEAFLDVAGSVHLFGSPEQIASSIRQRVRQEIGLVVSVGVARTKHLAKIASQFAKPDGLVVVDPSQEMEFLAPLPVELMWGVGPATRARLADSGVRTIGDLAAMSEPGLQHVLGRAVGSKLGSLAVNLDPRPVETTHVAKSVGAQSALGPRGVEPVLIRSVLAYLADRVASRLRQHGLAGRTITVRVRFIGLRSVTRARTIPVAISSTLTLTEAAVDLVQGLLEEHAVEREVTLLAISVSKLIDESVLQLELPLGQQDDRRARRTTATGATSSTVDRSVDAIRDRFGRGAIGFATVMFSDEQRVPEEFRELAQHDHYRQRFPSEPRITHRGS